MLKKSFQNLCGKSALTGWLGDVTKMARQIDVPSNAKNTELRGILWKEIEKVSVHAYELRETDSVFAVVQSLFKKGEYPPMKLWPTLAKQLLTYADVESKAVLTFPGESDESLRRKNAHGFHVSSMEKSNGNRREPSTRISVPVSREVLLLTNGVIPLGARCACGDGTVIAMFMVNLANYIEATLSVESPNGPKEEDLEYLVKNSNDAFLSVIKENQCSINGGLLESALVRYFKSYDSVCEHNTILREYLIAFLQDLGATATHNGLGSRLALFYVEQRFREIETKEFSAARESLLITVFKHSAEAFAIHYENSVEYSDGARFSAVLRYLFEELDVVFQKNTNKNNCLDLKENEEQEITVNAVVALLRALRVETGAPDDFLRESLPLVERCPSNIAVEVELIEGKAALLEFFDLDDTEKDAIYQDLIQSLRNLVSLYVSKENEEEVHALFQQAHATVIRALCSSHNKSRVQDAYDIVVAHKYHGLVVTNEIITPLTDVLSRQGDGRVFNLVDLCVLYSNCEIGKDTITHLFRSCCMAGDHYRARTLLQLFDENIPGFLLKASEEVVESLKTLKVIDSDPQHLFVDEEELLMNSATGIYGPPQAL